MGAVMEWLPVIGDLFQGRARQRQFDFAESMYDANAGVARLQAGDALSRGHLAEQRHRIDTKRLVGSQRAALGAQGIDVNRDSALDVQADTMAMGELDALTIRNNAVREAWGYEVQAANYGNQAILAGRAGRTAFEGSLLTSGIRALDIVGRRGYFGG